MHTMVSIEAYRSKADQGPTESHIGHSLFKMKRIVKFPSAVWASLDTKEETTPILRPPRDFHQ